jgi:hypothetical protein
MNCHPVIKLIFMYIKIYVNALLYIDKVEIMKKLKRQLMKVRTGLVSDDRVCSETLGTKVKNSGESLAIGSYAHA